MQNDIDVLYPSIRKYIFKWKIIKETVFYCINGENDLADF